MHQKINNNKVEVKLCLMKAKCILSCLIMILPTLTFAQLKRSDCKSIKTGVFYFYPPASQKGFLVVRNNTTQKEINLQTGDTSFWKITWQNACELSLSFLRKNKPVSKEELAFFNFHKTIVQILSVTKDYYVFKGGLDNETTRNVTDTLWFKKRAL